MEISSSRPATNALSNEPEKQVERFLDSTGTTYGTRYRELTIDAYRSDLLSLQRCLAERNTTFDKAGALDISDCLRLTRSKKKKVVNPTTVARRLSVYKKFFNFLLQNGIITVDPTVDLKRPLIKRRRTPTLSETEVDMFMRAPVVSQPIGHRNRTLFEVMCATGLRVSELVNLTMDQVDLDTKTLELTTKKGADRPVILSEVSFDWLKKFVENVRPDILGKYTSNYVFPTQSGSRLSRQTVWYMIRDYGKKAKLRQGLTAESLRRVFTAHLLEQGMSIPEMRQRLGHAAATSTKKYLETIDTRRLRQRTIRTPRFAIPNID